MLDRIYIKCAVLFGFGIMGYIIYNMVYSFIHFFEGFSLTQILVIISSTILFLFIVGFFYKEESKVSKPKIISPELSEKIINQYGFSLSRPKKNSGLARPVSFLSHTKDEIKTAYSSYITALQKRNLLTDKIKEELIGAYSHIDSFIDDEVILNILEIEGQRKSENLNRIGFDFTNKIDLTIMASMMKRTTEIEECF